MYKQLLLSAGGGIITECQKSNYDKSATTIAIGLGGMGVTCLRTLKNEVYDRIKPDKDDLPQYEHIKFFAIDTDINSLQTGNTTNDLAATEIFNLNCRDINGILANPNYLNNRQDLNWFKFRHREPDGEGIDIINSTGSTGAIRQVGRLSLFLHFPEVYDQLFRIIRESIHYGVYNINIHIFTGLCGGTGSGIFLDVCYLIQHILLTLGVRNKPQLFGYFFTPDVNINKLQFSSIKDVLVNNGLAALKELDYCMNFDTNGGEWEQYYNGCVIKTKERPVDIAFLISDIDINGQVNSNSYNKAVGDVVEHIICNITEVNNDGFINIMRHIWELNGEANLYKSEDIYCTIGTESVYIPYKEITTYLSSKMFEQFNKNWHQLPTDDDVSHFIDSVNLRYEDLCNELKTDVPDVPLYEVHTRTIYEQTEGMSPDNIPQALGQMRDSLVRIGAKINENKLKMLRDIERVSEKPSESNHSMILRTFQKLKELMQQTDKGPYYSCAILRSHNREKTDLKNIIDGYIEENCRRLSIIRRDVLLREQAIVQTLAGLQNSNVFNRNNRGNEYVQSVHAYYRTQANIVFFTALGELLISFREQVDYLFMQRLIPVERVMRELEVTFRENLNIIENDIMEDRNYTTKLMTIKDLKYLLDEYVIEMCKDGIMPDFVNSMMNNVNRRNEQDEYKIVQAVSQFFLESLGYFASKTIDDYFKIKFNTTDCQLLTEEVLDQIMLPLKHRVYPLFWKDYAVSITKQFDYCIIPRFSEISKEATCDLKERYSRYIMMNSRLSYCTDRISIFTYGTNIPMYAYKGFTAYKSSHKYIGTHIYEGSVADPRDWSELPDFRTLSE